MHKRVGFWIRPSRHPSTLKWNCGISSTESFCSMAAVVRTAAGNQVSRMRTVSKVVQSCHAMHSEYADPEHYSPEHLYIGPETQSRVRVQINVRFRSFVQVTINVQHRTAVDSATGVRQLCEL